MPRRGKAVAGGLLAVLCATMILTFWPGRVHAGGAPVTCADAEELVAAFEADADGDIHLSADIVFTDEDSLLFATQPTTVHMGGYSIFVPGVDDEDYSRLTLEGPITFTGSGNLFVLQNGARLYTMDDQTLLRAEGPGACAVFVDSPAYDASLSELIIQAAGKGAHGIVTNAPSTDIFDIVIDATGGAVPVRHTGNVHAYTCRLTNHAGGAVLDAAGGTGGVVNYCGFFSPKQANVWEPVIKQVYAEPAYRLHVVQGDEEGFTPADGPGWYFNERIAAMMDTSALPEDLRGGGSVEVGLPVTVEWDMSAFANYSAHVPGIYEATGTPSMPYELPGVVLPQLTAQVVVVPLGKPWIARAFAHFDDEDQYVVFLEMIFDIPWDADIKIWAWEQTETGWSGPVELVAAGQAERDVDWDFLYWLNVYGLNPDKHYRFQVEVTEEGKQPVLGNIIEMNYDDRSGGDRDLGDRDPGDWGNEAPPPAAPAPEASGNIPGGSGGQVGQAPTTPPATGGGEAAPPEIAASGQAFTRQQLLDLLAVNPQQVTLFCGQARVVVSAQALQTLLGQARQLNVLVDITGGERLTLEFFADGISVDVPSEGVQLLLPYTTPGEGEIFLQQGERQLPATLENGVLTVTVFAAGEYHIVFIAAGTSGQEGAATSPTPEAETPAPPPEKAKLSVWVWVGMAAGLTALCTAAAMVVRHMRRRTRQRD